ncbi:LacI family DNA-binding transcriptional regulator [Gordonia sp. Z-3]|uniref:LacI family DNA-binding transcriptional regulator n=1 Tax=Gordonia sp. Z-3 TaxID=3115408 RepID=UPI002E2E262A|nr:LacI family DNA-binding transcriptional regulator [Gordonia sp. Z-3]MED5803835.1 LacI family DNA-binding transcriptional regulator [Gordonia sp. Z-3]
MTTGKRPTMKDVARHAGVSLSTVSYVLNDSGPVAPDRRTRVLDAVRVLNYAPNEAARGLKNRSAPTIGLVIPELSNQFFALLVEGVEQVVSNHGGLVTICAPDTVSVGESVNGRLLRSQRLNGIVYLSGAQSKSGALLELMRQGPVVLVDDVVPGFDGLPAVVSDNRRGAREIAVHVIEAGHRDIAVIAGPEAQWSTQQRLSGYREAMAAAGIDPDQARVLWGDYHQQSGWDHARRALEGPRDHRPTALLCANDLMAVGALEYCRSAGISVPAEVSVVGFDDIPFVSLLTPRLTTVRQPAREMGQQAAEHLFEMIAGGRIDPPPPLPTDVRIRESVAPPPSR